MQREEKKNALGSHERLFEMLISLEFSIFWFHLEAFVFIIYKILDA